MGSTRQRKGAPPWRLRAGTGRGYRKKGGPGKPLQLPYTFQHGSLAPNGTLEGNMVFQVPQGDTGLSLIYEPFEQRSIGTITVTL